MSKGQIGVQQVHADAFQKILAVTRRVWGLDAATARAGVPARVEGRDSGSRRGAHLAQLAARAFEAQVMALRCRQAFVG